MLVLFDIDGTLLRSRGIGIQSMEQALEELHGVPVDARSVDVSGRLDPHVFLEICEHHDLPTHEDAMRAFREAYVARMAHAFEMGTWSKAMPGAIDLVRAVHEHPEITSAVLTGNIEPTSWMKLEDAGFDRTWFDFGVFGDEGETRRELPPIARARHHDRSGHLLDPKQTVVIGDTPKDVDCAHHSGCVAIAVATGQIPIAELHASGADLVLETLEETAEILKWIRQQQGAQQRIR